LFSLSKQTPDHTLAASNASTRAFLKASAPALLKPKHVGWVAAILTEEHQQIPRCAQDDTTVVGGGGNG
jgi:hypothetical protein